ncbi:MAG: DNA repair exonuclease [Spiribacter sp.]|jgi:predicted phosphodiesterase|nr:DNA repair exonuclease [Spiribacter sp.]MDR9489929.1 DNA repair exonuclease [Spiribacter sp.]
MTLKLLAMGDLHLGRSPTRLPSSLASQAIAFAPRTAWTRCIDLAIAESVTAVILAGDVVESVHDYFEALGELQAGVAKLARHNIRTIAVSGNHDVDVLPKLTAQIAECELLGATGQWQSTVIGSAEESSADRITLWGWSFPTPSVSDSPLAEFPGRQGSGLNIGVLHCDRDQPASYHAPVTTRALKDTGLDAWLLGHIHQPDALSKENPSGYLGTVSGLDAGESGPRGPWMITIDRGDITRFEQIPLAPIRWQPLSVDITGCAGPNDLEGTLTTALKTLGEQITQARALPDLIGIRLRFQGESDFSTQQLLDVVPESDHPFGLPGRPEVQWFIERCLLDVRPITPLEQLAERGDQPGLLAQQLLVLQQPIDHPERNALLDQAEQQAQKALSQSRWQGLSSSPPNRDQIAEWLRQSAQDALRAMLQAEAR